MNLVKLCRLEWGWWSLLCGHVLFEPAEGALEDVDAVLGVDEAVSFVGVDDELRGEGLVAGGVPGLLGLRSGGLSAAVAGEGEGGRGDVLDVVDGGGFGVDGRVVVDRCPEERDHPLIDGVFA